MQKENNKILRTPKLPVIPRKSSKRSIDVELNFEETLSPLSPKRIKKKRNW